MGRGLSNKSSNTKLTIIGNNSAGLKGKLDSFKNLVKMLKPSVVMLQETKLYRKGTVLLDNFCIFEKVRETNEGGGLMTIIHESLEPVFIPTKNYKYRDRHRGCSLTHSAHTPPAVHPGIPIWVDKIELEKN